VRLSAALMSEGAEKIEHGSIPNIFSIFKGAGGHQYQYGMVFLKNGSLSNCN